MQAPPNKMHKFMQFPAEIRLIIWEMAMGNAKYAYSPYSPYRTCRTYGCVQRFRFNLVYDAQRVKPGQDKSQGWVACFTPLKINYSPHCVFLRVCAETREIMLRKLSILTVHEQPPTDKHGHRKAPRKCHIPFDFNKDDFCVEAITRGLQVAQMKRKNTDATWDPTTLSLADLLDNAQGFRFAPRIKRFAIIPHFEDLGHRSLNIRVFPTWPHINFIQTTNGRNMATLAKRFPALVDIKSGIPSECNFRGSSYCQRFRYFEWRAASLRGKRQGGPSRMSEEDRDALYVTAWGRIFHVQDIDPKLYNGWVCLA
jgi:hypothetical protein